MPNVNLQVARPTNPEDLAKWYAEHDLTPDKDGVFTSMPYEKPPVDRSVIIEQVGINALRHEVPNLTPREYTPKIMVYVAGGATLRDHLDQIKAKCEDGRYDVITSNMTAKFLLAKGITPNFHLVLDPTEKKVKDIDYPEKVELLLGLQCHPALFEKAKELDKKVYKFLAASVTGEDGKSDKDAARAACTKDDPNLFGIGGGSMCGTRMIYFAGARGYRRIEYYGFDGSVEMKEGIVKCYAYTKPRGENILETEASNGRKFYTTMSLARQGEELVALLDILPGLDVEIYGDSLMRNQLEIYKENRVQLPERISPEYLAMQKEMHSNPKLPYGTSGQYSAARVFMAAAQMHRRVGHCDVLDYGCGEGKLKKSIENSFCYVPKLRYNEYDPAMAGKDAEPQPAEIVFCGDVMEHIEPERVEAVIKHIASLSKRMSIFVISLRPAVKTLPDGRNAHICVRKSDWWLSWLKKYFVVVEENVDHVSMELVCVCQPIPKQWWKE